MFGDITFAYPYVLYFFVLIAAIIFYRYYYAEKKTPTLKYSNLKLIAPLNKGIKTKFAHLPFALRMLSLSFIIIALARPQNISEGEIVYTEGIDMMITLDISGSMLAEDFKPNRIEAAKKIIDEFISKRKSDNIGLVIFAGEAFTQCPLTIDYNVLRNLLNQISHGMIEDGTAIGNAVALSVARLKDSKAKSKTIILLTDGVNNRGEVDPYTAALLAKENNIRIYSIGVGARGMAPYPFKTPFGIQYQNVPVEIDEDLMKKMSELTGGDYFRATDNRSLKAIHEKIDEMEKTRIQIESYRKAKEMYASFASAALILLALEFLLSFTILKKLP
jgi:Ca-activated chloride channel family protein